MRLRKRNIGLAVLLAAGVSTAALAADGDQALSPGIVVEGSVAEGEETSFEVEFEAGEALQFDAIPGIATPDVDLVLMLKDSDGNTISSDDDSGSGLNPRISFFSSDDETYTLVVTAFGDDGAGDFSVITRTVENGSGAAGTATSNEIVDLGRIDGRVEQAVSIPVEGEVALSFSAEPGSYLRVFTEPRPGFISEEVDTVLSIVRGYGSENHIVDENDDGGEGLFSRVLLGPILDENLSIVVRGFAETSGSANLVVETFVPTKAVPVQITALDYAVRAELSETSPIVIHPTDRRRYTPYAIYDFADPALLRDLAASGDRLVITAKSDAFDAYLELGFDTAFGFSTVTENDDSEGSLDARIEFNPTGSPFAGDPQELNEWLGRLQIRVSGPENATGEYDIAVSREASPSR
ncbi:MAG: hypothetical protein ABJP48_00200 [Erythrobacter sp.]